MIPITVAARISAFHFMTGMVNVTVTVTHGCDNSIVGPPKRYSPEPPCVSRLFGKPVLPVGMVYCTGCRRNFRPSGFSKHIRRRQNTLCSAAYYQRFNEIWQQEEAEDASDVIEDEAPYDVPQHDEDFFGSYEDDLEWPDEGKDDPTSRF